MDPAASGRQAMVSPGPAVLSVSDLTVEFRADSGDVRVVDRVSFDLLPGNTLGVVGESGSGKSTMLLAALGLLPADSVAHVGGRALLEGQDLLAMDASQLQAVRGAEVAMIFQDPFSALNPVETVGKQIQEAVLVHNPGTGKRLAKARAIELLEMVGVPSPQTRYGQYPHQFSGGMCQRVVIAMALANGPKVLIADEPTTALDVSVQAQILDLIRKAGDETGAATVVVTHDLGVVAEVADRVAVMYAGRIVEIADVDDILARPKHPYTAALIACQPSGDRRLEPIPGVPPRPGQAVTGCSFAARCALRNGREICVTEVPELNVHGMRASACHFPDEVGPAKTEADFAPRAILAEEGYDVVSLVGVGKEFRVRGSRLLVPDRIKAVTDVSLSVQRGETLGLVGESGSGKSTLAKLVMNLIEPTTGVIKVDGQELAGANRREMGAFRRKVQMVFQDPYASLNPRLSAWANVAEPLRVQRLASRADRQIRSVELLERVGIGAELANRFPAELSGGQRQRVAIARALSVQPEILVLDEAVSALDVSVQAQVLNLLKELQEEYELAYLFVSHDLSVVRQVSDRVAVMYLGRIVEFGSTDQVFGEPAHPYTQFVLSSAPSLDPAKRGMARQLPGEIPNPANVPSGCGFRTRCPFAHDTCVADLPSLRRPDQVFDQVVACHLYAETSK